MVLREVGEDRGRDVDAVGAPQLERVRGDLHHAGAVTAVEHLAERALEVDRLRSRAHGRPLLARDHGGHGAEQAGLAPGRLQQRADEERRGGLAVGPRDSHYGQAARGVPVEAGGGDRHRRADVLDLHLGHAEAERARDDERGGSALDRVGREVVPVAGEAGDAEEQGPGLHGTVVVGEAADLDRRPIAEQLSDGHPRAVYERLRTLRSVVMPVEDDPSRGPAGRVLWTPRQADRALRPGERGASRSPTCSSESRAWAWTRRPRRARRAARDEDRRRRGAGRALIAAGGTPLRHGHLYSYDFRRKPRPQTWEAPAGIRLTDVDRPAADLVAALRAAYPPSHPDHGFVSADERGRARGGDRPQQYGPLLPGAASPWPTAVRSSARC